MEFAIELGLFSGKVMVVFFALAALLILVAVLVARSRKTHPALVVENLSKKYEGMSRALLAAVLSGKAFKREVKRLKKQQQKDEQSERKRLFVLDFTGDIRASHVENLREEITTVLAVARKGRDEIVVRLESPGGMVPVYGLAATQLARVRQAGVDLTVCVDKVAASGGYMMACTANKIVAAPFAVIGSIGVVAQIPNFHRLLKKHDIDFEEMTAGEFKRTVTMFGELTEKGRQKALEQIEDVHSLFKSFVKSYRPELDLDSVSTGEYWFGERARVLKLVDELAASDDYIMRQRPEADIFRVSVQAKKRWSERLAENVARLATTTLDRLSADLHRRSSSTYPGH